MPGALAVLLVVAVWRLGRAVPEVLKYELIDNERSLWDGAVNLNIARTTFDSNINLLRGFADDIVTSNKLNFGDERAEKEICPVLVNNTRTNVNYNPKRNTPTITDFKLNSSLLCNTKLTQQSLGRLTSGNEQMTPLKGGLRKKRDHSWFTYIGNKDTKPSNPSPDPEDWVSQYVSHGHGPPPQPQPAPKPNFHVDFNRFGESETDPNSWLVYIGGRPPDRGPNNVEQGECGKVTISNPNPLLINGKQTLAGEWPWQIALYQSKTFTCGGTLVSQQHVVSAAHCVTLDHTRDLVNRDILTIYLGIHNLRHSTDGVQIQKVENVVIHPQYSGSTYSHDISVLKLVGAVQVTDFVRPACLWPEDQVDLHHVIGNTGSVVGWGINEKRLASDELALVRMPIVTQEDCERVNRLYDRSKWGTTYCAGFRDDTTACYGDSGGGMVLKMRDTWYLRGLVSLTINDCDPLHYIIFTDVAKFLPWIKENMH